MEIPSIGSDAERPEVTQNHQKWRKLYRVAVLSSLYLHFCFQLPVVLRDVLTPNVLSLDALDAEKDSTSTIITGYYYGYFMT